MTSQEPTNPHSADRDIRDTEVIVVSSPAPVFVDSTGRRRRLLRWLSYAFGGLCMIFGGLVSVSLAGGPVSSNAVLPLPDLRDHDAEQGASGPRPAPIPAPSDSARPPELFLPPRRAAAVDFTRVSEPRPPAVVASSPPPKTPASTPPTTKPVESTTVPTTPAPSTPVPSTTTPVTDPPIKAPPPPAPPAPPEPPSGGAGGGGQILDDDADETVSETAPPARSDGALAEPAPEVEATTDSTPEPSETAEETAAQP